MGAPREVPWVVIGGGIAGLEAARLLGISEPGGVLLEATDRFGGIVRSDTWRGAVLDVGPDGWVAAKPQMRALCIELGLGAEVVEPQPAAKKLLARVRNGLEPMPRGLKLTIPTTARAALGIAARDKGMARRVLLEPLVTRKNWGDSHTDESIGDFLRRRMGARWAREVSLPILAGIHSGDPDELSVRAAFPQFVEAEAAGSSLLGQAFARRRAGEAGTFLSLRGGLGQLVNALVEAAAAAGDLRLNDPVRGVEGAGAGRARVELLSGEILDTSRVVVATGPRVGAQLLGAGAPALAAKLEEIPHGSAHVVIYALAEKHVAHTLDASGFIAIDRRAGGVVAASFLSSKWPGRKPEGFVFVRAFLASGTHFDANAATDAELAARGLEELTPLLGLSGNPEKDWVRRFPRATPQPVVGHIARMYSARALQDQHPWLALVGAGYSGVGLGDALRSVHEGLARWGGPPFPSIHVAFR